DHSRGRRCGQGADPRRPGRVRVRHPHAPDADALLLGPIEARRPHRAQGPHKYRHESERMNAEHVDVLIIGAGISGIGAAVHLTDKQPQKSYLILEAREAIGGTWDLFRYPGIRSDSDLHTFCYAFKPWLEDRAIADGESILRYVHETAHEHRVPERIRF